jgi:hypothetical protein
MLSNALKAVARTFGFHVERIGDGISWNHSIALNFPVDLKCRWGHGLPSNALIRSALEMQESNYVKALADVHTAMPILKQISRNEDPNNPAAPFWSNTWFTGLDAASLVAFLCDRNPSRYIEVGSGFSTMFARHAIQCAQLRTTITSLDPTPRAEINALCNETIRKPLEATELDMFDQAEPGDIIFFDGSHRILQNSDVTVFFLEVLPRLKPGVLIHMHDIFLPDDYPPSWYRRVYSEQYLLATLLMFADDRINVLLPCYYVLSEAKSRFDIQRAFVDANGQHIVPPTYNTPAAQPACSFWFELRYPFGLHRRRA